MAPEVAYMRYVRDQLIGSSIIGHKLVDAWNMFYYSWSPPVARVIAQSSTLQALFRLLLGPLVMIIHVTAWTYATVGGGDVAAITSFAVAAALSISVYVALPLLTVVEIFKRHKHNVRT